jgi:hypothetical protein
MESCPTQCHLPQPASSPRAQYPSSSVSAPDAWTETQAPEAQMFGRVADHLLTLRVRPDSNPAIHTHLVSPVHVSPPARYRVGKTSLTPNRKQSNRPSPSSGPSSSLAFGSSKHTLFRDVQSSGSRISTTPFWCTEALASVASADAPVNFSSSHAHDLGDKCVKCTWESGPANVRMCYFSKLRLV